jgi:hypothetical protein
MAGKMESQSEIGRNRLIIKFGGRVGAVAFDTAATGGTEKVPVQAVEIFPGKADITVGIGEITVYEQVEKNMAPGYFGNGKVVFIGWRHRLHRYIVSEDPKQNNR